MLVTEQEAVATRWCPMIRLRWERGAVAFNRGNPGPKARFNNMLYRMFFPGLHYQMRSHFFRRQGSGCMMWRWETKDPRPSGILWFGRDALHVHWAVMDRGAGPRR